VSTRTATCVVVRHVVIEADGQERITYYGPFLPHVGSAVDAVIAANPDTAAQYKAGKTGLLGFFVGQVMKSAPGADAAAVNRVVRERLG
jgi:Asp-tRNA(Asn)/Glu-tRNA(Gln) amidotransferase B subunit